MTDTIDIFYKTPSETLHYGRDWHGWLEGDTLATSQWIVDAGLGVAGENHSDTLATVTLSGGAVGARYRCLNRITTANGQTAERVFYVQVQTIK